MLSVFPDRQSPAPILLCMPANDQRPQEEETPTKIGSSPFMR